MEKSIVIIRNKEDLDIVDKMATEAGKESALDNLKSLHRLYPQFAYSFEDGDILFATYEDQLRVSIEAAAKFFEIKQFYFDDKENKDFQCYWYNAETEDIVCGLDHDGYIRIVGNVIYDSIEGEGSEG